MTGMSGETDYGELNYAGFVRECGGVSPVTGEPLLAWAALCEHAREAWRHGAHYVAAEAERRLREALRLILAGTPLGRPASPQECEYIRATARGALAGDADPGAGPDEAERRNAECERYRYDGPGMQL